MIGPDIEAFKALIQDDERDDLTKLNKMESLQQAKQLFLLG